MAVEPGSKTFPPLGHWSLRSRCFQLGLDPDLFFEDIVPSECKAACAACTVRADCLDYALENEPQGFWGGCTMRERRRRLKAARAPAAPAKPITGGCPSCGRIGLAGATECFFCGARWPAMT